MTASGIIDGLLDHALVALAALPGSARSALAAARAHLSPPYTLQQHLVSAGIIAVVVGGLYLPARQAVRDILDSRIYEALEGRVARLGVRWGSAMHRRLIELGIPIDGVNIYLYLESDGPGPPDSGAPDALAGLGQSQLRRSRQQGP